MSVSLCESVNNKDDDAEIADEKYTDLTIPPSTVSFF